MKNGSLFTPEVRLQDGVDGLLSLDAASVDLVFSDLPSGMTQAPTDVAPDLPRLWSAIWRALKPDGNVVLMASHLRFAIDAVLSSEREFRYDLVWEKSRASGHLNAAKQPMRCHEHILVFYRSLGYYAPQKTEGNLPMHSAVGKGSGVNYGATKASITEGGRTDRYPRSVLRTPVLPGNHGSRIHHQQKPPQLGEQIVLTYCPPGGFVVDPFAGSGAFGEAALLHERTFVGFDTDPRYGR